MDGITVNGKFIRKDELITEPSCTSASACEKAIFSFLNQWFSPDEFVMLETSGSTGTPKPVAMSKTAMIESARRTIAFFGLKPRMSAFLCLPAGYIAGKMMIVRAVVGQLNLVTVEPSGHPLQWLGEAVDFSSFTPMQLINELNIENNPKLKLLRKVLVGGAPISSNLAAKLQTQEFEAYESYGMTETVSHIALKKLNGNNAQQAFFPMQGITVTLNSNDCIVIKQNGAAPLVTNDTGEMLPNGSFRVLGRADNVINSGGIKIHPEKIENIIAPYFNSAFCISSVPHPSLGETPVLVTASPIASPSRLLEQLQTILPRYEIPAFLYCVERFPLTDSGKIKRHELKQMLPQLEAVLL